MIANICWAPLTHERGRLCARAGCSSQKWKQFFLHVKIFTHLPQKVFMEFVLRCFAIITFTCMTMFGGMFSVIYFMDAIGKELGVHLKPISFLNLRRRVSDFPEDFPFNLNWALCKPVERAPHSALRVGEEWITEHDWKFNCYRFEDNRNIGNFPTSHLSLLWMARYIEP